MSTWMVVEDEPDIYEVLLAMFEMWGIEGVAFVDGEEAVAWIEDVDNNRFQGELPELALLDIRLPGDINGVMVGERLRKSPVLGQVAIVLTTAYSLTEDEQEEAISSAGADLWLPKPLPKFNELQGILEDVIAKRRAISKTTGTLKAVKANESEQDDVAEIAPVIPTVLEILEPPSKSDEEVSEQPEEDKKESSTKDESKPKNTKESSK